MNIKLTKMHMVENTTVKAVASILIDNAFALHDIKVLEKDEELMLAMPSKQDNKGIYRNVAHPINSAVREALEELIITEYNKRSNNK